MSHIITLPYKVVYSLNNDGIFKDPKALEDISQGCKHPLPVTVASPRGNDEQCEQDSQYIQHIFPFTLDLLPVLTAFGHIKTGAVSVELQSQVKHNPCDNSNFQGESNPIDLCAVVTRVTGSGCQE